MQVSLLAIETHGVKDWNKRQNEEAALGLKYKKKPGASMKNIQTGCLYPSDSVGHRVGRTSASLQL